MRSMGAIRTDDLSKRYGDTLALDSLNLDVSEGEVYGYLGPNGAGKTTTIRLLLGLHRPTGGRGELFGIDCWSDPVSAHRKVAYVAGEPFLWPAMTGAETLEFLSRLHGGSDSVYRDELVERFQLDTGKKVRALSKGNRQKVQLVAALATRADLLLLDEPDQRARDAVRLARCPHPLARRAAQPRVRRRGRALVVRRSARVGGAISQGVSISLPKMIEAGLNCLPASLLFLGVAALAYAVLPRASAGIAYGFVAVAFLWQLFGSLLGAPKWLVDATPFAHVGFVPAQPFRVGAAAVMIAIGLLAGLLAMVCFRRRDLTGDDDGCCRVREARRHARRPESRRWIVNQSIASLNALLWGPGSPSHSDVPPGTTTRSFGHLNRSRIATPPSSSSAFPPTISSTGAVTRSSRTSSKSPLAPNETTAPTLSPSRAAAHSAAADAMPVAR